jgi:hypothetical protein
MKLRLCTETGLNTETKNFKASCEVTISPKKKLLVSMNMTGSFARGIVKILGYGTQTWSVRALSYVCDDLHTFLPTNWNCEWIQVFE